MKIPSLITVILGSLILSSCSTVVPKADYEFNPNYDFSSHRTFGMLPIPHEPFDKGANLILGEDDIAFVAVRSVIESKGFEYSSGADVDFLVGLRAQVWRSSNTDRTSPTKDVRVGFRDRIWNGQGSDFDKLIFTATGTKILDQLPRPSPSSDPNPADSSLRDAHVYDDKYGSDVELILWIEIFDVKSKALAWKGWASSYSIDSFKTDTKRLETIARILEHFPY